MSGKIASRLGFILLSAGCAIGIGNVWRFPYIAGRSGGGIFVAAYLLILLLVGVPVLAMEFATGRAARRSVAKLHQALTPTRRLWCVHGVVGVLGNIMLMSFYTTVSGWMVLYTIRMALGTFSEATVETTSAAFGRMLSNPIEQGFAAVMVTLIASFVCAFQIEKVLERVTKYMMLALIALIGLLVVRSVTLPGAGAGVRFLLVPDLAQARAIGWGVVWEAAMNQAFFTLSLGIGAMAIFGSYINRSRRLLGEALHVTALDTLIALAAGLVVLPASFSLGVLTPEMLTDPTLADHASGPGLVFKTLPVVFARMAGGRFWGSLFFCFMSFAALSTVFAVFETIIASIMDYTHLSRRRVCVGVAIGMSLISLFCVAGFNVWSNFHPLGGDSLILDLEDFIVSKILLPIGAIGFVVYCTSRYGWGWKSFLNEVNAGEGAHFPKAARAYCAYVIPLIILIIFLRGLFNG